MHDSAPLLFSKNLSTDLVDDDGDDDDDDMITGYRTPCQSLEAYLKEVRAMAALYGAKEVFVASDDDDVLYNASRELDLVVTYTSFSRSMFKVC
jgi:hypothetical protein